MKRIIAMMELTDAPILRKIEPQCFADDFSAPFEHVCLTKKRRELQAQSNAVQSKLLTEMIYIMKGENNERREQKSRT